MLVRKIKRYILYMDNKEQIIKTIDNYINTSSKKVRDCANYGESQAHMGFIDKLKKLRKIVENS